MPLHCFVIVNVKEDSGILFQFMSHNFDCFCLLTYGKKIIITIILVSIEIRIRDGLIISLTNYQCGYSAFF